MSQENPPNNDKMAQIVQNLIDEKMEKWKIDKINSKFTLTLVNLDLDAENFASEERLESVNQEIEELTSDFEENQQELKEIVGKEKMLNDTQLKAYEFRRDLTARVISMEKMQMKQLEPKLDLSIKLINAVLKKIEDIAAFQNEIELRFAQEMETKKNEMKTCEEELARLEGQEADCQKEIQEIGGMIALEETDREKIHDVLQQIIAVDDETRSIQAATAQIEADKIAEMDFVNEIRATVDVVHYEVTTIEQKIEELTIQQSEIVEQSKLMDKQVEDSAHAMQIIQSSNCFIKDLETNKAFVRHFADKSFYFEWKEIIEAKLEDNLALSRDLENPNSDEPERIIKLENIQNDLVKIKQKFHLLHKEYEDISRQEAETSEKLEEKAIKARNDEKRLRKEISKLQSEVAMEEDNMDKVRNERTLAITELNMKLKMEQKRTKKAREKKALLDKATISTMNTSIANISLSPPPPPNIPKKQALPPVKKLSSPLPQTNNSLSQPPMKRQKNVKLMNHTYSMSQRSTSPSVFYVNTSGQSAISSSINSSFLRNRRKASNNCPVYKEKFNEKAVNKKSPQPVYIDDERAFSDSGESSISVTFNTDVEDLLSETCTAI